MSVEFDDFEREPPGYTDASNPALSIAATAALRRALARASENAVEVGEFWEVFRDYVTRYQYGEFVASMVDGTRSEVRSAIAAAEHKALREEALEALRDQLREEHEDEFTEVLRQQLLNELRPIVEKTLRAKLLADPGFIADTRAELQRKILGI